MVYLAANAMSELMSSSLTDTKTAECLSVKIGQICCLLRNNIFVTRGPFLEAPGSYRAR